MSIKKNFLYNVSYQLLVIFIPLITAPYVSRVIGVSGVGIISYRSSIATYFSLFAMLGLNNYGNRTIAIVKDKGIQELSENFWNIYSLQLITTTVVSLLYICYVKNFVYEDRAIAFIHLLLVVSNIFNINWFFFGMEEFKITISRSIIVKIASVIMIFLFVKNGNDLWIYALIIGISSILSQILLWPYLKNRIIIIKPSYKKIFLHFKPNAVLFIPVLTISIYKIMDKVMIGFITDMVQSGLYENSLKIIQIPMGIITALGTVMMPRISNLLARKEILKIQLYIRNSMQLSMFMAFGMFFGISGISPEFVPIFFGIHFIGAVELIKLLAITIIFISWANVIRSQNLIPGKKDKEYILAVLVGAIVNVVFNLLLIPRYGALGATIGTIAAELVVTLTLSVRIKNDLAINQYLLDSIPFILSGVGMYVFLRIVGKLYGPVLSGLLIQICVGALIYILLSLGIMFVFNRARLITVINEVRFKTDYE